MPIEVSDLGDALDAAECAFEQGRQSRERGLDVQEPALVQLRKACRTLDGGTHLFEAGYHTLAIEASFTALEKSLLYWLVVEGHRDGSRPPQSHTTAIQHSVDVGLCSEIVGDRLVDLWNRNRSRTYYRDGIASVGRAKAMLSLTTRVHKHVLRAVGMSHECVCCR